MDMINKRTKKIHPRGAFLTPFRVWYQSPNWQGCVPNSVLSLVPAPKLAVAGLLRAGCSYLDPVIAPHWVPRSEIYHFLYKTVPNYIQKYGQTGVRQGIYSCKLQDLS